MITNLIKIEKDNIFLVKKIVKNFFSEYVDNLTEQSLTKNDIYYIYFAMINSVQYNKLAFTKIFDSKENYELIIPDIKKMIESNDYFKISNNDKIVFSKVEDILNTYVYNFQVYDDIYKYETYFLDKVQKENYFFLIKG